jgi:hypothetical protein
MFRQKRVFSSGVLTIRGRRQDVVVMGSLRTQRRSAVSHAKSSVEPACSVFGVGAFVWENCSRRYSHPVNAVRLGYLHHLPRSLLSSFRLAILTLFTVRSLVPLEQAWSVGSNDNCIALFLEHVPRVVFAPPLSTNTLSTRLWLPASHVNPPRQLHPTQPLQYFPKPSAMQSGAKHPVHPRPSALMLHCDPTRALDSNGPDAPGTQPTAPGHQHHLHPHKE